MHERAVSTKEDVASRRIPVGEHQLALAMHKRAD